MIDDKKVVISITKILIENVNYIFQK